MILNKFKHGVIVTLLLCMPVLAMEESKKDNEGELAQRRQSQRLSDQGTSDTIFTLDENQASQDAPATKVADDNRATYVAACWQDSFLLLRSEFTEFIRTSFAKVPSITYAKQPMVLWNGSDNLCRLVHFSALSSACRQPTADSAFLSYNNKARLLEDLLTEIFPEHSTLLMNKYVIVGALDSHSSASSALERRLILAHKLKVPPQMFSKAFTISLQIAQGEWGQAASQTIPASSSTHESDDQNGSTDTLRDKNEGQ